MDDLEQQVRELHHRGMTNNSIALAVSRTRSRVGQILQTLNLKRNPAPKVIWVSHCRICGDIIIGSKSLCPYCITVPLKCSNCSIVFYVKRWEYEARLRNRKSSNWFCGNRCKGVYWGNAVGFKAHPENIHRGAANPEKRCSRCKRVKARSEFYSGHRTHSMCRACFPLYAKEWRAKQKEATSDRA